MPTANANGEFDSITLPQNVDFNGSPYPNSGWSWAFHDPKIEKKFDKFLDKTRDTTEGLAKETIEQIEAKFGMRMIADYHSIQKKLESSEITISK